MSAPQPLAGVRVLDLTRLLPGNLATFAMAMLGADVIKVEDRAAGDYMRDFGVQVDGGGACNHDVNRAKRSVALDLRDDEDARTFAQLVGTANVLVESFRPGVLDRLGFGVARLHEIKPDLVIASISGYGSTGPLAAEAGHDINYLAFSGILHRLGHEGGPAALPPLPLSDLVGGGLVPALLVIAYLRRAEATGQGAWIDASMAEGLALLPHVLLNDILAGEPQAGRGQTILGGGLACYDVYATRDGEVVVGALEEKFWQQVLDVTGGEQAWRTDHFRAAIQDDVRAHLASWFGARTTTEAIAAFAGRDTCVSAVQSMEDMLASPQAEARGYVVRDARIPVPVLRLPALVDGHPLPEAGPAPRHGEHQAEVLAELDLRYRVNDRSFTSNEGWGRG